MTDEQILADVAEMVRLAQSDRYYYPYSVKWARDGVVYEWRISAKGIVTEYRDGVYVSRRRLKR